MWTHRYSKYFKHVLYIGDILILNASFVLGYLFSWNNLAGLTESVYVELFVYSNVMWVALVMITRAYEFSRTARFSKILRHNVSIAIIHFLLVTGFFVLFKAEYLSRLQMLATYTIFAIGIFAFRFSFVYLLKALRAKGFNRRNVIVVGYGYVAEELYKFFRLHPEHGFRFLGFFDDTTTGPKIIGRPSEVCSYIEENQVDEVYCCLPHADYSTVQDIIEFGDERFIQVKLLADYRGFNFKGLEVQNYDHIPIFKVRRTPLDEYRNRVVKRAFDILVSSVVITLVMSWLLPLMALCIKISSQGPVFFMQRRAGKDNNPFWCLKFRTMVLNNEADCRQAKKNDPRITLVGKFLRRTSLDELPQIFNVLMGDMSLIGPRPHPLKLNEEFSPKIYKFHVRHHVKPGITGLAQAKGYRGETQQDYLMNNRVKLDRFYIENWSFVFDMKILALTIVSLYRERDKAY